MPTEPLDDLALVRQTLAGHAQAYAELVRRYHTKVLRLCTSLLSDPTLAEDAGQEIFLKAYQALPRFRGASSFSTWLYRIAANHCKDLLRTRARHRTESWEALLERHGEPLEERLSTQALGDAVDAELIERILSRLSPEQRIVLTLREVEGLSYQELAQTLHCSVDAIKARLRRTRQALREIVRHFAPRRDV